MKRFLFFMIIYLNSSFSIAQEEGFHYGGRALIGSGSFASGDLPGDFGGLVLGGGMQGFYQFKPFFGIGAEGVLVVKGSRGKSTESSGPFGGSATYVEQYQILAVEVPILLKVNIPIGDFSPKVFAGVGNNFLLGGIYTKTYTEGSGTDESLNISGLPVIENSVLTGAGFDIQTDAGIYSIDIRFNKGITPLGAMPGNASNPLTNYYAISVGASF